MDTIRSAGLYFKGKKVAEVESHDYGIATGSEAQHGSDGLLGYSTGQVMTKITANTIIPVRGISVTLIKSLLNQETVVVGWSGGGQLHQIEMKILEATIKSESKAGKLTGTFNFEGGVPEVQG